MNILIVDDCDMQIELLKKFFNTFNTRTDCVYGANNGLEALDIIRNKNFDVLITDINMPVMDGLVLIKKIISENIHIGVKIIVMSAELSCHIFSDDILPHISGFLEKPFSLKQIKALIESSE